MRPARAGYVLAGGLVMVVILTLASVGGRSVLAESTDATDRDRVFADFSTSQLDATNDGTPLTVLDTGRNVSGLKVLDSELTHGAPTESNAAGFLEARIDRPVSRIGAVAQFHSPTSGALGLVSSAASLADDSGTGVRDRLPDTGMLFAATNRRWHFSVWDSAENKQHVLLHGTLALSADGTAHGFEVVRYGDTVTIRLPDGTMRAAADPRIAEWSGPWAYWQLYEFDARQVPVSLTAVWAG